MLKKFLWWTFVVFCILISLYPISYFIQERTFGLLGQKSELVLTDLFWNIGFYMHIIPGGIALAVGWSLNSGPLSERRSLISIGQLEKYMSSLQS